MKWDLSGTHEMYAQSGSTADTHERLGLALAAPDGRTLARQRLGRLWFVDDRTGTATPPVAVPDEQSFHDFSSDGRWFLATGGDEVLRVWNTRTGRLVAERPNVENEWTAAFDVSADRIYLAENYRRHTADPGSNHLGAGRRTHPRGVRCHRDSA